MPEVLQQTVRLASGGNMPFVGLGTWRLKAPQVAPVLERAIELGCRHVDCAAIYGNEIEIGKTLKSILDDPSRFKVERKDVC